MHIRIKVGPLVNISSIFVNQQEIATCGVFFLNKTKEKEKKNEYIGDRPVPASAFVQN